MKTLQNFLANMFAVIMIAVTLTTLDSCRKADDVSPAGQTNQSEGSVAASVAQQATTQIISTQGFVVGEAFPNSPECGGFMLIRKNAPSLAIMSAELDLRAFVNKSVTLKGYLINQNSGQRSNYLNVTWIKTLAEPIPTTDKAFRPIPTEKAPSASMMEHGQSSNKATVADAMDRSSVLAMISAKGIVRQARNTSSEPSTYILIRTDAAPIALTSSKFNLNEFVNKSVALKGYIVNAGTRMTYLNLVSIEEIGDRSSTEQVAKTN